MKQSWLGRSSHANNRTVPARFHYKGVFLRLFIVRSARAPVQLFAGFGVLLATSSPFCSFFAFEFVSSLQHTTLRPPFLAPAGTEQSLAWAIWRSWVREDLIVVAHALHEPRHAARRFALVSLTRRLVCCRRLGPWRRRLEAERRQADMQHLRRGAGVAFLRNLQSRVLRRQRKRL